VEAAEDVVGSAGGAAGSGFAAFASGAVIPILPFFVTSGITAITTAAVLVGVALFATGATVGVLTGGPLVRRGLRQLAIGAAAALVTYGLGRVFGATLGWQTGARVPSCGGSATPSSARPAGCHPTTTT
jgi:VIT1/CCC1 family predicted Fe2+/Mn2+ transporter